MKLLLTVGASTDDIVQLEPTIEALYYKYENCELTLRISAGYEPFFEHHPLIHEVVAISGDGPDPLPSEYDIHTEIPDIDLWTLKMPLVEKFAAAAGVTLLRKTPKIFLDEYPADENYIVLARVAHNVPEWPTLFARTEPLHKHYETRDIGIATDADDHGQHQQRQT